MNALHKLEELGFRFRLAIDYDGPDAPPPEAGPLLDELAARKPEALRLLIEREHRAAWLEVLEALRNGRSMTMLLLMAAIATGGEGTARELADTMRAIAPAAFEPVALDNEIARLQRRICDMEGRHAPPQIIVAHMKYLTELETASKAIG